MGPKIEQLEDGKLALVFASGSLVIGVIMDLEGRIRGQVFNPDKREVKSTDAFMPKHSVISIAGTDHTALATEQPLTAAEFLEKNDMTVCSPDMVAHLRTLVAPQEAAARLRHMYESSQTPNPN